MNSVTNKNAFQWDAYRLLVDRIPACTGQGAMCIPACTGWGGVCQGCVCTGGVCPGRLCLPREVVSAQGGCVCPGRGCLPREGVSTQGGLPREGVSAWGVYPGRGCLPGGVCLRASVWGVSPPEPEADNPLWTDRHL